MAQTIITIGREFGSGGSEVGHKISEMLDIPFYDKEIISLSAEKSGLSESFLRSRDERMSTGLLYTLSAGMYPGVMPINQDAFQVQFNVIRNIASQGSCVIVGRCADYVLRDHPHLVNCFIHAPLSLRIDRIAQLHNLDRSEAKNLIKQMDKQRSQYYSFYVPHDWGRAQNYHLCIDSEIGTEKVAQLISNYVKMTE